MISPVGPSPILGITEKIIPCYQFLKALQEVRKEK